ncbi:putative poly(A)-specific ribonuclease PARN [Plasmodium gaboni]|uniref:Putative poly(A)-specific ribonuclease PARN n=1 Tax=Plasmodium gaboni TaxID=647221 RepID=A0A151LAW2_9APIC|nr:putative poly(A)-specific ribonuclease PARN [Plasmodium gaboni]KYN96027.1 putative poly(A)-specific ribonuclease PARN [Plasmodium gaboni]
MSSVFNYFFKNFVLKEKRNLFFFKDNILKRGYSKITSVNLNNWNNIHKEIINKINNSDFVSIDVEYTGLHLKDERYISLDSSYEAHCHGAKSFFPCQIGISIAKKKDIIEDSYDTDEDINKIKKKKGSVYTRKVIYENENMNKICNIEKKKQEWHISPYCIYVFPKENKYFSVSTSTLSFLKENNFDFNEWIFNGVGYLRPNEEEEKKKNILEKINELNNLLSKCDTNKKNIIPGEKIHIDKIIQEIENYKIVDEEDKEAIICIIKKIGKWISNTNSDNNFCKHQEDEKKLNLNKDININYINNNDKSNDNDIHININIPTTNIDNNNNYNITNSIVKEKTFSSLNNNFIQKQKNELTNNNVYNIKQTFSSINSKIKNITNNNITNEKVYDNTEKIFNKSTNENDNECYNDIHNNDTIINTQCDINNIDDISNYPLYLEIENPYLRLLAHTLITKYFDSIFCISVKVNDKKHLAVYRTEKDSYKEQIRNLEQEIEKINQIIGVRLLFDEIIKNKKIIIGHNCFYDILHIYQTFYHDLPKSINVFKKKWTELFPYTFDTKYMNETNEYLYALNGPATLKGLCEYMASLISSSNDFDFFFNFMNDPTDLPQCFIPFINRKRMNKNNMIQNVIDQKNNMISPNDGNNIKNNKIQEESLLYGEKGDNIITNISIQLNSEKNTLTNNNNNNNNDYNNNDYDENNIISVNNTNDKHILNSDEHNAGYDSLLTCLLFIFQCHYILKKNNLMWKDIYFSENDKSNNMNSKYFFDIFLNMSNKIKIVKTQPNVISLCSAENYEMARHFYMYDYPRYFKKWEIMKIWSPIWITLSKVDDQSCWIIAKSDDDAKNIKMIYKMLQNPQFKLCTYEEYMHKFKSN